MKSRKGYLEYRDKCRRLAEYGGRMSGECPFCGGNNIFDIAMYDAKFCMDCDKWLEDVCGDPECTFCAQRPYSPSGVLFEPPPFPRFNGSKDWRRMNYQHKTDGAKRHTQRYRI
ncbi:MAG: hypothetical protein K6B74_08675 [Ruminococcus sp.]|nr:hypothetical protein [Ruminococcus sp.]